MALEISGYKMSHGPCAGFEYDGWRAAHRELTTWSIEIGLCFAKGSCNFYSQKVDATVKNGVWKSFEKRTE